MYDIITQPRLLEYFLSCERFLYKRFLHDSFRVYTDRRIPFNEEDNAIIKKKEKTPHRYTLNSRFNPLVAINLPHRYYLSPLQKRACARTGAIEKSFKRWRRIERGRTN